MSHRARVALFAVSGAGLGLLLGWGMSGLPGFGDYPGPYGNLIVRVAEPQRHIANAVTAVVFDYRGIDTLGEELILLAAAFATAMLLRETRDHDTRGIVEPVRSEAVATVGLLAAPAVFLLALQVVAHGYLTPGGGFQGGVILSAAFLLVFLTVEYRGFRHLTRPLFFEPLEAAGAATFAGLALLGLALGDGFLGNFLPLGSTGRLTSSGSVPLVNWASGVAVAAAMVVIYDEYLQEVAATRHGRS